MASKEKRQINLEIVAKKQSSAERSMRIFSHAQLSGGVSLQKNAATISRQVRVLA